MKLAHITMYYFPIYGGQENYIFNLNNILGSEKYEYSIIQPKHSDLPKPENVHYTIPIPTLTRYAWFWFNGMLRFKKKIIKQQDILICHYPIHYNAIAWHKKIIVVSHGVDWPKAPEKMFDKVKKENAEKLKHTNATVVANDTDFIRQIGIPADPGEKYFQKIEGKTWFIPNCVDINKFKKLPLEKKKHILVPRNIRKSRGIHLIIEAFAHVTAKHPDLILRIVGGPLNGPYYENCLELVRKFKLNDKVTFAGNISNDQMPQEYNEALLTVIPTLAYEGTSLSALESMACGTPVVSTSVGGLADLPTYQVASDAAGLADGIGYVLQNLESESNRQETVTRATFNLENWGKAWTQAINEC